MINQMRQSVFQDASLSQLQSSLNDQFSAISSIPFMNGVRITGVSLVASSTTNVNHKLGRLAQGYFVTSNSANAVIWNGAFTTSVIPLETSANTTVDLWVF